jgi:hypothetical protein
VCPEEADTASYLNDFACAPVQLVVGTAGASSSPMSFIVTRVPPRGVLLAGALGFVHVLMAGTHAFAVGQPAVSLAAADVSVAAENPRGAREQQREARPDATAPVTQAAQASTTSVTCAREDSTR